MSSHEIEFFDKIVPDAYHGTSKASAAVILRDGFAASVGPKNYLGDGVYFFEGARTYAVNWAQKRYGLQSVVLHAIINLGYCLDFHIPEHVRLIQKWRDGLHQEVVRRKAAGRPTWQITDAFVINLIAKKVEIDTVRAVWLPSKSKKIFSGSHFIAGQLIICVRNLKSVLSVKMV
ncbi:MAG TPA: hypothetical protein VJT71_15080 [Pyrinomonadaceae bacterium]|nr:hypothetical protein [Pyrinomonadaceae bacterium]